MHSDRDEVIPEVSDGSLVTELAGYHLRSNQWITCDDAWLMIHSAMWANQRSFINFIATVFTVSHGKSLVNIVVHVHVKHPVSDVVSLVHADQVLLGKRNVIRRWDICILEI